MLCTLSCRVRLGCFLWLICGVTAYWAHCTYGKVGEKNTPTCVFMWRTTHEIGSLKSREMSLSLSHPLLHFLFQTSFRKQYNLQCKRLFCTTTHSAEQNLRSGPTWVLLILAKPMISIRRVSLQVNSPTRLIDRVRVEHVGTNRFVLTSTSSTA